MSVSQENKTSFGLDRPSLSRDQLIYGLRGKCPSKFFDTLSQDQYSALDVVDFPLPAETVVYFMFGSGLLRPNEESDLLRMFGRRAGMDEKQASRILHTRYEIGSQPTLLRRCDQLVYNKAFDAGEEGTERVIQAGMGITKPKKLIAAEAAVEQEAQWRVNAIREYLQPQEEQK